MSRENPYRSLKKQQRAILDAVHFFLRKGEAPTVREVGALVGLRSPATVLKHLRALERANLVTRSGKSRGIRLTETARRALCLEGHSTAAGPGESPAKQGSMGPRRGTRSPFDRPAAGGRIPIVGAIAAGRPFQSYDDGFIPPDGGYGSGSGRDSGPDYGSDSCRDFPWSNRLTGRGYSARGYAPPELADEEGWFLFEDGAGVEAGEEVGDAEGWDGEDQLCEPRPGSETSGGASGGGLSLTGRAYQLPVDPHMFVESGDVFALKVEGDSMINAGILDGDFVIIRRQETVEEGEIAAVIINGEGTLKRWHSRRAPDGRSVTHVRLDPANERFEPIEISEDEGRDVLVFGKYVGLVRGNLRML